MKKNAAQREFKKLKGQIANIENIIKHSKAATKTITLTVKPVKVKVISVKQLKAKTLQGNAYS